MTPIFADPVRQQEFEARGYTIVRLLPAADTKAIWSEIEPILPPPSATGPQRCLVSYHDADDRFRGRAEEIARRALAGRLAAVIPGHRFVAGGFFVKPGGAASVGIHRDWTSTEDPADVVLGTWCALGDVEEAMGALRFVPGSHRLFSGITCPGVPHFFAEYDDMFMERSVPVELEAGEAAIFDGRTVHWSPPNRTSRMRAAVHAVCVPNHSRFVSYVPDPGSGGTRFEMFDIDAGTTGRAAGIHVSSGRPGPSLGFVENRNRPISRAECERRLDEIEAELAAFARPPAAPTGELRT